MGKFDPYENEIIRQCQLGIVTELGWRSGSFCRKRDLCRAERRCHFVSTVERYLENHGGMPDDKPRPPRIIWHPGFDTEPILQLALFEAA